MKPEWSCILFDLDGTITDSAPGITASLARMFADLHLPVPSPAELVSYVGPPILDSFRKFAGFDPELSARALGLYREHYKQGVFDSTVYPGIPQVLRSLHQAGFPLSLATSKPERLARVVLEHFGLDRYFTIITGASDDESRSTKADVVAEALRRFRLLDVDVVRPVLVGDRSYDVAGAAEHGVPTIFAGWGYGSPAEQIGSIAVVERVEQLIPLLTSPVSSLTSSSS